MEIRLVRSHSISAFCVCALFLLPGRSEAAKFVADLTSYKVTARPGDVLTHPYRLTLDAAERPTRFKLRVEDWWRSEDGQQSFYAAPGTLQRSCSPWVSLNPIETEAQPGIPLAARLTIKVPADVRPGGYWCVLTIDELPDPLNSPAGVGAQFVASVSTGIFVYVEPLERSVQFTDVTVGGDYLSVTLNNDGNAPVAVEGRVEFRRRGETEPLATVDLNRVTVLTEPVTRALLRVPLPSTAVLPSGTYLVRVLIDIGLEQYLGVEREVALTRGAPLPVTTD